MRLSPVVSALLLSAPIWACDKGTTPPRPVVSSIEVSPPTVAIAPGGTMQLTALARDQFGAAIPGPGVSWATSDTAVATVSASGLVSAVRGGTARITASAAGIDGFASVTVGAGPPAKLVIVKGDGQTAYARWTLPDTLVVRVVDASEIPIPGVTVSFQPNLAYPGSGSLEPATVVSNSQGLARSVWTLGATVGQQFAVAFLADVPAVQVLFGATGTAAPVARVLVTPAGETVQVTKSRTFNAWAYDAAGKLLSGHTFTWACSDTTIASLDQKGVLIGRAPGTVTITATTEAVGGSVSVTIARDVIFLSHAWTNGPRTLLVNSSYPDLLTWTALDAALQPFAGVTIRFSGMNGVHPMADSAVTDAAGRVLLGVRTDSIAGVGAIEASTGAQSDQVTLTVEAAASLGMPLQPRSGVSGRRRVPPLSPGSASWPAPPGP